MKRTYIPVQYDKSVYRTLYYDTEERRFFESFGGKQSTGLALLSGTVGVILNAYFGSWTVSVITGRLAVLVTAAAMSLVLSALLIGLTYFLTERSRDSWVYVTAPSAAELPGMVRSGRRWLLSQLMLILGFFLLNSLFTLFLLIFPDSGLVFAGVTILWAVLFLMLWGVQPFARLRLLRSLEDMKIRQ
ncbi:hypothetical protein NCCP2716_14630 [Sporosarcina sp. NCCP-2716]|uniref:hypothetical protein n=1 Tax=Sporosarcina sp. NCCP-2716 TaxID=2943679 RepID=UPI00203CF22A|nr:hypothetical protein [Sporosarcina sp. NCCP-2716]GKV68965.1 hypothetical protein NCCP2716_14630 [Sporosarcina sp. NCCP-2716]